MANLMFCEKEMGYLKPQRLARIITTAADSSSEESMQPDVVPVGLF
ncbi:MAG: hypothetical protein JO297_04335 [Nitrososphaeraceae archaeon]|nr:hypothetical protein [Nitrososphaeraceae archaeon]